MKSTEQFLEHTAAADQLAARRELQRLYEQTPLPPDDLAFNLGLYARSGLLVKFLVMYDIYRRFLNVPGVMVEFGVWWGQNAVLLENLRAILEPFNKTRRYIGFDTFEGYRESKYAGTGIYDTGRGHIDYLAKLLKTHQQMNVYGHQDVDHVLIPGDVTETAPKYFDANPHLIVAFACFDLGPYAPTLRAMEAVQPHLVPGSVLLLDELTLEDTPGEAVAFFEVFGNSGYRLEKVALYPSKSIAVFQ